MKKLLPLSLAALLGACAGPAAIDGAAPQRPAGPLTVKIIGLNDFHGNLEPPKQSVEAALPSGEKVRVPVGGAAYLASAVDKYRAQNPKTLVVAAGDLIGASPITSSLFLDEPTIGVMNRIGLDFNAVGNHEFDRGRRELVRMQTGGCEKYTVRQPCQVEKSFEGAKFKFLAANVRTENGDTLFPATAIRKLGTGNDAVTVGLIGLTLKDTPNLASPSGLTGLTFAEEVGTINALVPKLKADGADVVVLTIHQGLYTKVGSNDKSCGGVSGDLLKILGGLDPRVDLVVSGHTHWAYVCDFGAIDASRPFLVTSAGVAGQYLTDIDLTIDPATRRVTAKRADNVMIQSEAFSGNRGPIDLQPSFETFAPRADVAAYVEQYRGAAQVQRERPIGKVSAAASKPPVATAESQLGNLIADSQLEATRSVGAQFALMNNTGIRNDLIVGPDKAVTFGTIFAIQPFANELKTMTLSGADVAALLEQQFDGQAFDQAFSPSGNVAYSFDLGRAPGSRVFDIRIDGKPIDPTAEYRLTMNSFLASGGDSFTVFRKGRDVVTGGLDLDALEAWIAAVPMRDLPPLGRVRNLTAAKQP
ncbi:MAG: bifunctional metallophosphatase/5'-nucleotidase [Sphingopyxis sp.]|nr:bifunctional metallophosphatase/5'-nucleotidase [Sphingopyxis sp.]